MTTNNKDNYATTIAADQSLIAGLTKHAATLTSLLIAGASVLTTDLVTMLQARIAAIQAAIAAHSAFTAAVAAAHAEITKTAPTVSGARQALKIAFSGQPTTLGDFGSSRRRRARRSPPRRRPRPSPRPRRPVRRGTPWDRRRRRRSPGATRPRLPPLLRPPRQRSRSPR
jgi:hypothetical protein